MKFLIAFALFAVAVAVDEIQVVHLPEAPAPAYEQKEYAHPRIVPLAVLEALMAQYVNDNAPEPAVLYDATVAEGSDNAESIKVHFVDAPVEIDQDPEVVIYRSSVADQADGVETYVADEDSLKVRFVDSPVMDSFNGVKVAEPVEVPAVEAVKVVDAPRLDNVFAEPAVLYDATVAEGSDDAESVKVHFVDAPVEIDQDPEVVIYRSSVANQADGVETNVADEESLKVRIVDSPVMDSFNGVKVAEPVIMNEVPEAVKVVDAPMLGKVFADPRLR